MLTTLLTLPSSRLYSCPCRLLPVRVSSRPLTAPMTELSRRKQSLKTPIQLSFSIFRESFSVATRGLYRLKMVVQVGPYCRSSWLTISRLRAASRSALPLEAVVVEL